MGAWCAGWHHAPLFWQVPPNALADNFLTSRRLRIAMKKQSNKSDGESWLDQYPVEVLEAVLEILQAQEATTE
jgi:hypothetical protein